MLLSHGKIGAVYHINKIELNDDSRRRFEILGMTGGACVEILNVKHNGALIIKVRGTRFAIGRKFADGIIVGD